MKLPLVQKQGWKRVGGGNQYIDFLFISHWPNPLRSQKARTSGDAALRPVPQGEDQHRKRVGYGSRGRWRKNKQPKWYSKLDSSQPHSREMVVVKRGWNVLEGSWMLPFSKIHSHFIQGKIYAGIPTLFCSLVCHITESGNGNWAGTNHCQIGPIETLYAPCFMLFFTSCCVGQCFCKNTLKFNC